jgi:hypothetical protein
MGIEFKTELISTNLPPKLIFLLHQEFNLLRIFSTIGVHVDILLGLAPTGRPRYSLLGLAPRVSFSNTALKERFRLVLPSPNNRFFCLAGSSFFH